MLLIRLLVKVSLVTLVSRILGFVRDITIARVFGINWMLDSFLLAFKLPNLFRKIFSDGILLQVFVPVLTKYKNNGNLIDTYNFIAYISGLFIILLLIVIIITIFFMPKIIILIAPGFIKKKYILLLTIKLSRVIFPYIILILFITFTSAILNVWGYEVISLTTSIFLNISMITFTLLFNNLFSTPILGLAWSVIIGGIIQLCYQLIFLKKINMLVFPKFNFNYKKLFNLLKNISTVIIINSINQISNIINTIFASFFVSGSLSWIYYADRIIELPAGLLITSLNTILLPILSRSFIQNDMNNYLKQLNWGIKLCFIFVIPSTIALIILSYPIVITLFQYNNFSVHDLCMIQKLLSVYSTGLIGLVLTKLLTISFYSRNNTKVLIKMSLIIIVLTQIMNILFVYIFDNLGLSISNIVSYYIQVIFLYFYLLKNKLFFFNYNVANFLFKIIISVLVMSFILIKLLALMPSWDNISIFYRLIRISLLIMIGILVYFFTLWITGLKLKEIFYFYYNF
ncbi:MAG: murein biosynthesis integral membrane protein MurJ [Candidatus Lightella neohaematopini]|nr:murein biosynthesis integral membrane protein MurJ [Candidatus Lightella neohaematopini]